MGGRCHSEEYCIRNEPLITGSQCAAKCPVTSSQSNESTFHHHYVKFALTLLRASLMNNLLQMQISQNTTLLNLLSLIKCLIFRSLQHLMNKSNSHLLDYFFTFFPVLSKEFVISPAYLTSVVISTSFILKMPIYFLFPFALTFENHALKFKIYAKIKIGILIMTKNPKWCYYIPFIYL